MVKGNFLVFSFVEMTMDPKYSPDFTSDGISIDMGTSSDEEDNFTVFDTETHLDTFFYCYFSFTLSRKHKDR